MKLSQLKIGSLLSYIQMGVSIVINLIYTPIMIKCLGQSEYGLYQTVSSTISMLSILSLGFNASYIRYFSKYKNNNEKNEIYKLNGLFLLIFLFIGVIAFVCGLFITINLNLVFSDGLSFSEYVIAKKLMFILTINLTLMFPMSVFQNIISAYERFIALKLLGMIKTIFSPLLCIPLLLLGYKSIALVSVTLIISIITDSLYIYYVLKVLESKFVFHGFNKNILKDIVIYTSFIAINLIVDQINMNIDKIIIARYRGAIEVGVYSVGFTLYQLYQNFSSAISGVFTPRIHAIVNKNTNNKKEQSKLLTTLFIKVGRIQFLILGLISTGIIIFGYSFIVKLWAGAGFENSYLVAILLIIPSSIALIQNLGIEMQRALNKHQYRSIIYLLMAIINLFLSIILCQLYGAVGSAIGTSISLIVANGFIMNVIYYKICHIDVILFWKNILRMSLGLICPIFVGVILNKTIVINGYFTFILCIIIYTLVYIISMWLISMNKYEKKLILKPLNNIARYFMK